MDLATSCSRCGSAIAGQRQAGQVGVAQPEHPRREPEPLAVLAHVAQVDEGEQEPPRRGAGQAGGARDLAERQLGVCGPNAAITLRPRSRDCTKCGSRAASRPSGLLR